MGIQPGSLQGVVCELFLKMKKIVHAISRDMKDIRQSRFSG